MDSITRYVCGFLLAFSLTSAVNAAETRPLIYRSEQTKMLQDLVDKSEILHNQKYETVATTPSGQQVTRYTTRATLFSKARLGAMARGALGGPLAIGITTAIVAANFYFDDDNVIMKPANFDIDGLGQCSVQYFGLIENSTFAECTEAAPSEFNGYSYTGNSNFVRRSDVQVTFRFDYNDGFQWRNIIWTAYQPNTVPSDISFDPTTATDTDIGDILSRNPNLSSDIISDSIGSGRWPTEWPEAKDTAADISDTLGQDIEGTPAQNYDDTISDGSTVTQPESEPSSLEIEFPVFCEWASVVCSFIDWFKADEPAPAIPDLPITEVQQAYWDSGLSEGVCPANPTVEFMGSTLEYDLTTACWGASTIFKPILLIISLIAASFIIIGAKD